PDCGKKISVFGESRAEEAAKEYGIPLLAQMPINPKIAERVDRGMVEAVETPWLEQAADIIEAI
ncbi:MAG: P-loop NTPase, partial [Clostridium sp.]